MRLGIWRIVAGLLLFWLFIIIYLNTSLIQSNTEQTDKTERQLGLALSELDQLKLQNEHLYKLAATIKSLKLSTNTIQWTMRLGNDSGPSSGADKHRYRLENGIQDLWYYLNSEIRKIRASLGNERERKSLDLILANTAHRKKVLLSDLQSWREKESYKQWREDESRKLGDIVQARLDKLQNPSDCSRAKKILCNLNKGCGFGCQLHHTLYCLVIAYGSRRTLILDSKGWRYQKQGWEKVFKPLSKTCTDRSGTSKRGWGSRDTNDDIQVVELPIVDSLHPRPPYMPLAVPRDIQTRLSRFHGNPITWWLGQLLRYLMRLQPSIAEYIENVKKSIDFKSPIVGIHVRRTDKVGTEAAFHSIEEYMIHVKDFYQTYKLSHSMKDRPRVYLASDDPTVLPEAREKYPEYTFLGDVEISKSAGLGSRYTGASLRGIIQDITLLSQSDFIVCTFSSQLCRLAYELMQTYHVDASDKYHSLDDVYYFGGQNKHEQTAVLPHRIQRTGEIELMVGDRINVAGNHWDGYSKGRNKRTGKTGLYPTYKVEDNVESVPIPGYQDKTGNEIQPQQFR